MSLTTLAQIKAFSGINTTAMDAQLGALQGAAEATILSYLGRQLNLATYTEFYTGNGTKFITLRQRPVTSIISINEDFEGFGNTFPGAFDSTTLLTSGTDYMLDFDVGSTTQSTSGRVYRIATYWLEFGRVYRPGLLTVDTGPVRANIMVSYTAGYATIPEDIQYAVCFLVAYMRRTVKVGANVLSERLGDYGYHLARTTLRDVPELGTVRQLLSRYRELPW